MTMLKAKPAVQEVQYVLVVLVQVRQFEKQLEQYWDVEILDE